MIRNGKFYCQRCESEFNYCANSMEELNIIIKRYEDTQFCNHIIALKNIDRPDDEEVFVKK